MSRKLRNLYTARLAAQPTWLAIAGCFFACGSATSGEAPAAGGLAGSTGGFTAGHDAGGGSGGSAPSSGGVGLGGNSNSAGDGGASGRAGASNDAASAGSGGPNVSGGASTGGKLAMTGGMDAGGVGGEDAAGAPSCAELNMTRQTWLKSAIECDLELDGQCAGVTTVPNQCGCPTLVNSAFDYNVKAAQAAYDAWVAAGCGPYACGAACFVGTKGICDPQGSILSSCIWQ